MSVSSVTFPSSGKTAVLEKGYDASSTWLDRILPGWTCAPGCFYLHLRVACRMRRHAYDAFADGIRDSGSGIRFEPREPIESRIPNPESRQWDGRKTRRRPRRPAAVSIRQLVERGRIERAGGS